MQRRRGAIAVSLLGIASMELTTLLQMGIGRRLPNPPIRRFDGTSCDIACREQTG